MLLNILILTMASPDNTPSDPPGSLVVLDVRGDLFDKIRKMDLGRALWRTLHVPAASDVLADATVLLLAAYDGPDWSVAWEVARPFPDHHRSTPDQPG